MRTKISRCVVARTSKIEILRYAAATLELPGKSRLDGSILPVVGRTATHRFLVRGGTVV